MAEPRVPRAPTREPRRRSSCPGRQGPMSMRFRHQEHTPIANVCFRGSRSEGKGRRKERSSEGGFRSVRVAPGHARRTGLPRTSPEATREADSQRAGCWLKAGLCGGRSELSWELGGGKGRCGLGRQRHRLFLSERIR